MRLRQNLDTGVAGCKRYATLLLVAILSHSKNGKMEKWDILDAPTIFPELNSQLCKITLCMHCDQQFAQNLLSCVRLHQNVANFILKVITFTETICWILWCSKIRPLHSCAMLGLFGSCLDRAVKNLSDTVRWRSVSALIIGMPGEGLHSLPNLNRLEEIRWWQTWKLKAVHQKGSATSLCDGRLMVPTLRYFTLLLPLDMLIE